MGYLQSFNKRYKNKFSITTTTTITTITTKGNNSSNCSNSSCSTYPKINISNNDDFNKEINPIPPIPPIPLNNKKIPNRANRANRVLTKNNIVLNNSSESKQKLHDYSQLKKNQTLHQCPICKLISLYSVCPQHWFKWGRFVPAVEVNLQEVKRCN